MTVPIPRRTAYIKLGVQLWPPPPLLGQPSWWGYHDLSFHVPGEKEMSWTRQIEECAIAYPRGLFKENDTFGWVLEFELTHQPAKDVLQFVIDKAHSTPPDRTANRGWWRDDWVHPEVAKKIQFEQFASIIDHLKETKTQ